MGERERQHEKEGRRVIQLKKQYLLLKKIANTDPKNNKCTFTCNTKYVAILL